MCNSFKFTESNWKENGIFLEDYLNQLSFPMDSYIEDHLEGAKVYTVLRDEEPIGFAATHKETLWFFYIRRDHVKVAQEAFEAFIKAKEIKGVYFQTSDTLLVSLTCDWEFEKFKGAYFFIDGKRVDKPNIKAENPEFKLAKNQDIPLILEKTGKFFDKLEERVSNETIFMLMEDGELLGCGIIEYGRYFKDCCSIGMITCKDHRQKGVGQYILWNLKEFCYNKELKPIAGCWYYNPLSKKTLEAVGMISVARGMNAKLLEREVIPLKPMDS
ncbi:GNAT family N-acetyltransferase [Alkaliphilus serpentinus]|uniref:GNAT family N-acetyltransferase n=1 Tax=Alkaliphilus serpentinus TaxID=1482731 RepID=A0A833HQB4_9FIRM|nr:GNAT family N-acetyltransferase [Alkaliphilus serpentinus]KAB3531542.1 GNAT family N-acetyltransferase [Alkaliphilus serpentinus]